MLKFQSLVLCSYVGYVSFYCITVQIMQFPVLDFGLDQCGSAIHEPFNSYGYWFFGHPSAFATNRFRAI